MSRTSDDFLDDNPWLLDEDRRSRAWIEAIVRMSAPLAAYFRFDCHGFERVPDGPCLIVANHSIGAIVEILLLLRAWYRWFGDRPARGLVHRVAWQLPFRLLPVAQKIGGIYAHPMVARQALDRGHTLLVFPGGDLDTSRPFSARYAVRFGGRTGYVRLAREAGVPIVPLVFCGAHAAYVVLPGGEQVARRTGLGRAFGIKAFPFTLGTAAAAAALAASMATPLAWPIFLGSLFQAFVPLPTRIEAQFLPPLEVDAGETDEDAGERVRLVMEESLAEMGARRATPWG